MIKLREYLSVCSSIISVFVKKRQWKKPEFIDFFDNEIDLRIFKRYPKVYINYDDYVVFFNMSDTDKRG